MTNLRVFAVSPSSPSTWSLGEFGRWLCGSTAGVVQGKENRGRDAQEETTGPILCSPQNKSEQSVNDPQPTTETRTTRPPSPLPRQAQRVRFGRKRTIPCGRPAQSSNNWHDGWTTSNSPAHCPWSPPDLNLPVHQLIPSRPRV